MVKYLLIAFGVTCALVTSPSAYAQSQDVEIQYVFANYGDKSLDISVDGAKLISCMPKEASTQQTGKVQWRALRGVTSGWALFNRTSKFEISVGGVESDHEVIFADQVKFINITIDQHNETTITLLNVPQDLD